MMQAVWAGLLAAETPHEAPNPILPLWQEIVVGSVAFVLLAYVLMKYVFPRMEQTFAARVEAIEGGIKRAEERQAEANALFEQYRQQLAEARSDAGRIREEAHADAESIRADMQARSAEERDRIIAAGRDQLAAERSTIVRELQAYVGELAVDLASAIVGESLADEARRRGTVERFLSQLDELPTAPPPAAGATRAGSPAAGGRS